MSFKEYLRKLFIFGFPMGLVLLIAVYGLSCLSIGSGIRAICQEAVEKYPGDTVDALIMYMEAEEQNLQKRNRAVWALGQIGQAKALPYLIKHYTGNPCDHSRYLCQHEIKKAISACQGSWNAGRWTWIRSMPSGQNTNI